MPALALAQRHEDVPYADSSDSLTTDDIVMNGHYGTLPQEQRRSLLAEVRTLSVEDLFARSDFLISMSSAGTPA